MRAHPLAHAQNAVAIQCIMQWHAMAAATQRQRRKFNPPVKKLSTPTTPALSQESCSSNLSWSLPPTQTHTVLSYCESEDGISTDSHKDTNAAACTDSGPSLAPGTLCKTMAVSPGNAERDNSKILKRKYNYCMFPHRAGKPTTTNRCDHKPKSGRHSVYEYLLTPSEPVTQAKAPRQRNKEQVRTIYVVYN